MPAAVAVRSAVEGWRGRLFGGRAEELVMVVGLAPFVSTTSPSHARQGLTLVHFSAQLELCLTQGNTLHTLKHPLPPP